jgi:hypothetical protein
MADLSLSVAIRSLERVAPRFRLGDGLPARALTFFGRSWVFTDVNLLI